jgi:hypothetical protein
MLLRDDGANALLIDETRRASDRILEQRASALERAELLWHRRTAWPCRQRTQTRPFSACQHHRPYVSAIHEVLRN